MKHNQKVKEQLDALLSAFETGDVAEAIAHTVINSNATHIPMNTWSFQNQLLCYIRGTGDARGFRQWKKIGRNVKKGSKALHILVPLVKKRVDEDTQEEHVFTYGFKCAPVFRFEDTEGEPVPEPEDLTPPEPPPLLDVANAWDIPVQYIPFGQSFYGQYRFGRNQEQILLCTHDESTFFHELAHAAHNRFEPLKGGQNWKQEIVAELAAAALGRLFGKETDGRSYQYIAGYAKEHGKDPHTACMQVLQDVKSVLDLILETAEAIENPLFVAQTPEIDRYEEQERDAQLAMSF